MPAVLVEKLKQKCFFASSFEATNNERNLRTFAELEQHAKVVTKMVKHVREAQKSITVMLKEAEHAYEHGGPHLYQISDEALSADPDAILTSKRARAVPLGKEDPSQNTKLTGLQELQTLHTALEEQLKHNTYMPGEAWLHDFEAAKAHMADLDKLRLELDHARRVHADAEMRAIKAERNRGGVPELLKGKLDTKNSELEACKTRFKDKEAAVHEELQALVERSDVLRDCIQAAFEVAGTVLMRAAGVSPLSNSRAASMRPASPGMHQTAALKQHSLPSSVNAKALTAEFSHKPGTPASEASTPLPGTPGSNNQVQNAPCLPAY